MSSNLQQQSQLPALPQSKVPSIKQLLEPLGFQHASIKETDKFLEATRVFRKSYQGPPENINVSLLQWNEPSVQGEYRNMANDFLADDDNGNKFWGSKRHWYSAGLQYPEDSDRIVALLMQLFFKQTRYAFNNLQYGHKQSDVRDESRDTTTPGSEIFPQQRQTPSSGTVLGDSQDLRTSCIETINPQAIVAQDETIPTMRSTEAGNRCNVVSKEANIWDVPDDVDEPFRTAFDILNNSEGQPPQQTRPAPRSGTTNPRKRKKRSDVEPRRSGRKPVPTFIPGVISNPAEYDAAFEESSSGSSAPFAETTAMGYTFDRDSSVEIMNVSSRNVDLDGDAVGASSSVPATGRPFKAPTAPMMTAPTKPKSPVSKMNASAKLTASSKIASTAADIPSTTKIPAARSKIVKLSMPSSKAQAKPLWKAVEARKMASKASLSAAPATAPSSKQTQSVPNLDAEDSTRGSATPRADVDLDSARRDQMSPTVARDVSRTHSPRASGTSDETLESGDEITDQLVNPTIEREAQSSAVIPDDTSSARTQLANSAASKAVTRPASIISSEPVDIPSQATTAVLPPPPAQVSQPQTAPTVSHSPPVKPFSTSTPKSAPPPKAQSQIPLWVITRTPELTEELWDTGRLSGLTLPSFLTSLSLLTSRPAESIDKVIFTLRTPISKTKISVGRDAEESWARLMGTFKQKLREVKGTVVLSEVCSIMIEPIWEEVSDGEEGEMGEENVDVDLF